MEKFNNLVDTNKANIASLEKLEQIEKKILPRDKWRANLEEAVEAAQTTDPFVPFSVIFVDIDNLKGVNDTYGHLMGDDVIDDLQLSMILIAESSRVLGDPDVYRKQDVMAYTPAKMLDELSPEVSQHSSIPIVSGRIGGDEFAIFCPADEKITSQIADRICENFYLRLRQPLIDLGVDVSIGTSTLAKGLTARNLLEEADRKLYEDKKSHLKNVSDEAFEEIRLVLEKHGVRPRDVPKHFLKRLNTGEILPAS